MVIGVEEPQTWCITKHIIIAYKSKVVTNRRSGNPPVCIVNLVMKRMPLSLTGGPQACTYFNQVAIGHDDLNVSKLFLKII